MTQKEIDEILSKNWPDELIPPPSWTSNEEHLAEVVYDLEHQNKMLINKCKELAEFIKKNNILV